MHGSGYQMMLLAQKLERELAEARRERDDKDKQLASCYDKLCKAEARIRDSCLEGRGDQEFPPCGRAIEAESRAAALEEALSQMLDDMGVDGLCVCPAAKEQAIAAMGEKK
jgi:hypothetical protein